MSQQTDIPTLARKCYEKLQRINGANFNLLLSQYTGAIEFGMMAAKQTPAAAMVEIYNRTESRLNKAWLLAGAHELTTPKPKT